MEVSTLTNTIINPLMVVYQPTNDIEPEICALSENSIMNCGGWVAINGVNKLPNLVAIQVCLGENLDVNELNDGLLDVYTIIASVSDGFEKEFNSYETHDDARLCLRSQICSIFSGELITLPDELQIMDRLMDSRWSYRVLLDTTIYPVVLDGNLTFWWSYE